MRHFFVMILLADLVLSSTARAQTSAPGQESEQTARQALIEMFLGKGENDFVKHLPDETRRVLIRKGETPETSNILKVAMIGKELSAQNGKLETFDTGSTLLVSEDVKANEKVEITVEHDILTGENDEIELSVQYYKDHQLVSLPVVPRFTFTFHQEKEIWRLVEVTAAAHVPLTDPDYLKGLRKEQDESLESQAKWRVNAIMSAEASYNGKHPDLGYNCSLQTLFARDPDATPENGGPFDPGQGNPEWNGYRFAITDCEGMPPSKYRVTATPNDPDADLKTFCADQTGNMKFVDTEKPSTCFSRGHSVNSDGNTN
jgi:hypothetical protein